MPRSTPRPTDARTEQPSPPHVADPPGGDRFVDDREASEILNLSPSYLGQMRVNGGGCRFSRFGRAVRYRVSDLFAWASSRAVYSTSEPGAGDE